MIRIKRIGQDRDFGTQVLEFPLVLANLRNGNVALNATEGDFHYPKRRPNSASNYNYTIEIPTATITSIMSHVLDQAKVETFFIRYAAGGEAHRE